MSKRILLPHDKYTIVDNSDYDWLMQWTWHCDNRGYAARADSLTKKVLMHRQILFGLNQHKEPNDVDHKNHDTLDNRRKNLRSCTRSENFYNKRIYKNNHSGHKGIYWSKENECWIAQIRHNKIKHVLGAFDNINDAIKARKRAEIKYHKEFRYKESK